jgi:hypothetical protein
LSYQKLFARRYGGRLLSMTESCSFAAASMYRSHSGNNIVPNANTHS